MELEDFHEALSALVSSGAQNYGDGAFVEVLHRELARFEVFVTEATAAFEAGEKRAADGAKTAAAWVATRCRVPRSVARRRVRLARTLRHLPCCAEAWREGQIRTDQARAIASARRHRAPHRPFGRLCAVAHRSRHRRAPSSVCSSNAAWSRVNPAESQAGTEQTEIRDEPAASVLPEQDRQNRPPGVLMRSAAALRRPADGDGGAAPSDQRCTSGRGRPW